jgi:Mycothiol maleylpyruvate isomerase N-terminal domain
MANKDEVVGKIQKLQTEIEQAVSSMPEEGWSRGVYEGGWNARQILAHIASTSGTAGFILGMARTSSAPTLGGSYDENAFNDQQVAARESKTVADVLAEIQGNLQRGIDSVRDAPDELLARQFRAPWGIEGEVGKVIVMSLEGHLGMHLADLRSAADS